MKLIRAGGRWRGINTPPENLAVAVFRGPDISGLSAGYFRPGRIFPDRTPDISGLAGNLRLNFRPAAEGLQYKNSLMT